MVMQIELQLVGKLCHCLPVDMLPREMIGHPEYDEHQREGWVDCGR